MSSLQDPVMVGAALKAAAVALSANERYETPRDIAMLALEIIKEWDKQAEKQAAAAAGTEAP